MGLSVTKRKGSPYWYIRGTVKGTSVFESTGIPHANKSRPQKIAEDYCSKRNREIEEGAVYGKAQNASFLDAATSYLQAGGSPRFLDALIKKIGDKKLRTLDQSFLNGVAVELYPDCQAVTINRQFWTPFIAVWNHAAKGNNPLCNPVEWQRLHIAKRKRPREAVSYEDAIRFINAANWHAAKILLFLFWTGCRPEEAYTLQSRFVYPERRWISIETAKGDVPRGIPMHECLVPLMQFVTEREGHVFLSALNEPYAERKKLNKAGRVAVQGGGHIKGPIATAQKATGLNITPYIARHTVSTYLIWPGGVNPHIKDEILGHADASDMSKHYTHLPRQSLIDAIAKLPDPRSMGLREDLWVPCKIRAMAATAYRKALLKQMVDE